MKLTDKQCDRLAAQAGLSVDAEAQAQTVHLAVMRRVIRLAFDAGHNCDTMMIVEKTSKGDGA